MEIIKSANPLLKKRLEFVQHGDDLQGTIESMIVLMLADPAKGVGLAANQVGVDKRFFILKLGSGGIIAVINPEITSRSNECGGMAETCLSYPGRKALVRRPLEIEASYFNQKMTLTLRKFRGFDARVFQHEMDHLNGITMFDRQKKQRKK